MPYIAVGVFIELDVLDEAALEAISPIHSVLYFIRLFSPIVRYRCVSS